MMFTAPGAPASTTFAAPATDVQPPRGLRTPFSRPGAASGGSTPPPTGEQAAIVDAYLTGQHLTVEALAGTGKTTSLRQVAHTRPDRPGLYLAYNRAIADDAQGRFPYRVACGTAHSYAYRAIGNRYAHRLPSSYSNKSASRRLPAFEVARRLRLHDERIGGRSLTSAALARIASATVDAFCRSADAFVDERHLPRIHDVPAAQLAAVIVPAARRMWADLCDPGGELYFTHDHYLKMWQLSGPVLPADYVLFDEAQDANPVIAAIVAAQDHAQLIYVGDRSQAIYGWRGAVDAMDGFDGVRLPLTRSFRFGPAIAGEANRWLDLLDTPLQVVGHDPVDSTVGYVAEPVAILCRTNGGSIGAVIAQLEAGRRVALVGDGKDIQRFAWAAKSLMDGKGCDLPELAAFRTWRELCAYVEEDESGRDLKVLVNMVNRYGANTLIDTIKQLTPEKRAEVTVSTAHKAKGREWSAVRIGDDFTPPAEGDRPDRAELMLAYVAVTRAQHRLDLGSLDWPATGRIDDEGRFWPHDLKD